MILKSKNNNSTNIKDLFQIKIQISIKQQYLIGTLLVKKDLTISLATKMLKNRPLCIFRPKMSAYKRDSDEAKYMSFLMMNYQKKIIKFEKNF